jgi:RNA polymerase sigma-54 factor
MDLREIPHDALARRMIYEAWDLFLRRQFPAVAKKLGVELPVLEEEVELIIGNLNPDGFLVATLDEILAMGDAEGREYTMAEIEEALCIVRSFDPPGIACVDLRESLLLQMDMKGIEAESLARRMVDEAWDLFLRRQFPAVAKKLNVDLPELEAALEVVRTLETHPGRQFSTDRPHYIEPDVFVRRVGDEYVIQLNDDGLPRLRVSRAYRRMLQTMRSEGRQSEAQQFIKDKIRSAVWLIKSLDQRQRTIYKVASSIVRQQNEFLDRGIEHLRPMVLRDVAEDIGMHESTVSRVVSNKYIHTQRGLFPMKFFFHSGIDREYGDNISSLTVKRKIEQLIQAEDPKRPLSDSELMRILNREGIQIARRTVAKYRDELSIPSSTDRKQIF